MTIETKFHFSPRQNRAHEIKWRQWGEEAFREARETGKPILLSLSAVWCHWCHVMDETSYSDEGVIAYINEHYIPVRVDNDQRPDINARYNMGGWPTTAFLTPDGEVLAGSTYVPPGQMKELLPRVNTYYLSNREEVSQKIAELRRQRAQAQSQTAAGDLSAAVYEQVLGAVANAYDPVFGGFGDAPKFPHTDAIDLLLYAYRRDHDPDVLHMARKTLEFMCRGEVFDHEWGGFFRYATRRDWSEPHYEKMLEDNANLLRNLLGLYRITNTNEHSDYARRTIDYLERKLRDGERGYFYGSQDADEEFYKLPKEEREKREEPYIDRTCYASWNAMAASAYLEASWTLDRPDLAGIAARALDFLWENLRQPGAGICRFLEPAQGARPQVPGLLGDQAYTARALLDAHEAAPDPRYLDRALELAGFMLERFAHRDGDGRMAGFFDVWDEHNELGRLAGRQKSLPDNAVCAEVFQRLHHLTREEEYKRVAEGTLRAFVPVFPQMGRFAASYAKQVDVFLNPPAEINIVGSGGAAAALHRAALSLKAPARIVQVLDPERDTEKLAALYLPPAPAPAAYVCLNTMCSAPVTEPDRIAEMVAEMRQGSEPR
jgi:uncharacterized protein YyaL (SSP411 family)